MSDLKTRFRGADGIPAPHLWQEITGREPRPHRSEPSAARRILIAAFALAIAVAGISFTVHAFGGGNARPTPGTAPQPIEPKTNGLIYFQQGGGDGGTTTDAIQPDGSARTTIFGANRYVSHIAWSPDGTKIAYVGIARYGNLVHFGIFVANPDGTGARQLTDGVNEGWPSWSPDGAQIAFSSSRADPTVRECGSGAQSTCPTDIYVMNANGSAITRLTDSPAPEYAPAWSPDGTSIAFVRTAGDANEIDVMNPDGTGVTRLASGTIAGAGGVEHPFSWSPDGGSQIAFTSIAGGTWAIDVVNSDGTGGRTIFSTDGVVSEDPIWSPDGTQIAFSSTTGVYPPGCGADSDVCSDLFVMDADGSHVTRLTHDASGVFGIAWQPLSSMTQSPTTGPAVAPASKVYFAWPGEITVVDVSTDTASTVDVPTLGGGDPQYAMARIGDRLAYWGHGTFTIDPANLDAPPVKIANDSWYFVPSATPGRIWAVWQDPKASTPYHFFFDHLREISSDGTVRVDGVADGDAWMDAAVSSGVVMETKDGLVVWDPNSGSVVARIPGAPSAAATFDNTIVWCDSYCHPSMHFTDVSTGDTSSVDPLPEYPVFDAWGGAFSPDGSTFAVPVWSTARGGPRAIALVDVSTGSVTELVPGSATDGGCCDLSWDSTGQRLYYASFGPSGGNGEYHLSYWDVGSSASVNVNVSIPRSTAMVAG